MQNDTRTPTLAHDLRALADLYFDVVWLMARRLTGKSRWERSWSDGPIEMVRPVEEDLPEFVTRIDGEPPESSLRSE